MYIWEHADWPRFRYSAEALLEPLAAAARKQGTFLGRMAALGFDLRTQTQLLALTEDVLKTSEIEGEKLDRESVRSSLARRLGLPEAAVGPMDRQVEGVVAMTLEATSGLSEPLTAERLFGWQAALFPTGYSDTQRIKVGGWRDDSDGPMQVVSGPYGRRKVHYEAPPAARVEAEMEKFFAWFNAPFVGDGLVRAALAHLWFLTVHPFEDGNGRVGRAIADRALAQMEGSSQRFYSLSAQILNERKAYYDEIESAQKEELDVTEWLVWFVGCFARAVDGAQVACSGVLARAEFWRRWEAVSFNDRQKKVLNRLLDRFEGKLTSKKWQALTKTSSATAQRDISDLVALGVLVRGEGGSKNANYEIAAVDDA